MPPSRLVGAFGVSTNWCGRAGRHSSLGSVGSSTVDERLLNAGASEFLERRNTERGRNARNGIGGFAVLPGMGKDRDPVVANMRARAEQCRRLAAALTDLRAIDVLTRMAEEIDADIRRLEGAD
jgi:hypothetical protein